MYQGKYVLVRCLIVYNNLCIYISLFPLFDIVLNISNLSFQLQLLFTNVIP